MADMKQDLKSVDNQQNYSLGNNSDPKNMQELTQTCSDITARYAGQISDNVRSDYYKKLDEMGNRIDDLEKNIADLMTQAGVEGPDK